MSKAIYYLVLAKPYFTMIILENNRINEYNFFKFD